ncbi:unnamed protein product [Boreogadus saida]
MWSNASDKVLNVSGPMRREGWNTTCRSTNAKAEETEEENEWTAGDTGRGLEELVLAAVVSMSVLSMGGCLCVNPPPSPPAICRENTQVWRGLSAQLLPRSPPELSLTRSRDPRRTLIPGGEVERCERGDPAVPRRFGLTLADRHRKTLSYGMSPSNKTSPFLSWLKLLTLPGAVRPLVNIGCKLSLFSAPNP